MDTKFTAILTQSRWREGALNSHHPYQLYAYLRSQERNDDPLSNRAEGILLHPAIDASLDESVLTHGHAMRFRTVDLARPNHEIIARLREVVLDGGH